MEEKKQKKAEKEENQWTPEEAELVELLSDMVFSKDTWKTDMEQREPADRIRMLMYEHSELLAKMVKNRKLSEQVFEKLKLPGAENMTQAVKNQLDQLLNNEVVSRLQILNVRMLTLLFQVILGDEQDKKNEIGRAHV